MSTLEQVNKSPQVRSAERPPATGIRGWWTNGRTFMTEVRNEMRRVTWPSKREVYATTFVVIVTATFFGLYLFGLDMVFTSVANAIFRRFGAA